MFSRLMVFICVIRKQSYVNLLSVRSPRIAYMCRRAENIGIFTVFHPHISPYIHSQSAHRLLTISCNYVGQIITSTIEIRYI